MKKLEQKKLLGLWNLSRFRRKTCCLDILIYGIGAILLAAISIGFVVWGFRIRQFHENEHVKRMPLEGDEDEYNS